MGRRLSANCKEEGRSEGDEYEMRSIVMVTMGDHRNAHKEHKYEHDSVRGNVLKRR